MASDETEADKEDAEKKALAARNVVATVEYRQRKLSFANQREYVYGPATRGHPLRSGHAAETARENYDSDHRVLKRTNSISVTQVPPPPRLRLRSVVAPGSASQEANLSREPVGSCQVRGNRPRLDPRRRIPPQNEKKSRSFGSCFGSPPSLPFPPRKSLTSRFSNRVPPLKKPGLLPTVEINNQAATEPPLVITPDNNAQLGEVTSSRSSSCRCSTIQTATKTGVAPQSPLPVSENNLQPGPSTSSRSPPCRCFNLQTAAASAGNKEGPQPEASAGNTQMNPSILENDPVNSSGQQILNAQAAREQGNPDDAGIEPSSFRHAEVDPFRGFHHSNAIRAQEWQLGAYPEGDASTGASNDQFQARSPSRPYDFTNYDGGRYNRQIARIPVQNPAAGSVRLFDSIIGPRAPEFEHGNKTLGDLGSRSKSPRIRDSSPSLRPNQSKPIPSGPSNAELKRQFGALSVENEEHPGQVQENPPAPWNPHYHSPLDRGIPVDRNSSPEFENTWRMTDRDHGWHNKDPLRPAVDKNRDPRSRGYPDPSFNPRPGDIIIRARKRAGLRLTDFYYYDNENYIEEGDQILRAKFEYLRPMETMYLWCRLYVCGPDGEYIYLDSTNEVVAKFKSPADERHFKETGRFL